METVYKRRKYSVLSTEEAKVLCEAWLEANGIGSRVTFGLPEVDDRYHHWRVPLKSGKDTVGYVYVDAYTSEVDASKTTDPELIVERIGSRAEGEEPGVRGRKPRRVNVRSSLGNTVIHGLSESVLYGLPEGSVDLIFTSPPYYNARPEYSEYKDYEDYLSKFRSVVKACHHVLAEGRFMIVNVSPVLIPRASRSEASRRIPVPFHVAALLEEEGFEYIDDIQWVKPEGAGWAAGRGRRFSADRNPLQYKPVVVTESILVYRKKTDLLIDWHIRTHPKPSLVQASKIEDGYEVTNVWRISPARDKRHEAIFPLELAEKVVRYYSFKGDVVCDPYAGIGTVGAAAARLGRRFVLVEKEERHFRTILHDMRRWLGPEAEFVEVRAKDHPWVKYEARPRVDLRHHTPPHEMARKTPVPLLPLVPERLRPRLKAGGRTFIETAGMENVRRVIADVLLGVNVRNATETLTRRRLIAVRTALRVVFQQLLKAGYEPRQIPTLAVANLKTGRISREERWLNLWLLGLTQKSNTNVLRDDSTVLDEYAAKYVESHRADGEDDFDPFPNGGFHYEGEEGILLENLFGSSVSAMSLAIRGSEKSAYGKVFEKLVLGSLLHTLGFTMITEAQAAAGEVGYVLSSTEKRESDATLYTAADQVIRFDLGFIGQGNPEITLDKVTRFEREMPVAGRRKYVSTVIIVDSVSEKSKVPELAKEVGGMVFEMRRNDWLLSVAAHFERLFGYDAAHLRADPEGVIRAAVDAAPFVTFLQVAKSKPAKSKASKSKASEEV